ncbi:MAG TPA: hypothetical protein PLE24_02185 [Chitinispirillaceae bacterium]|nr:hypothetical protein [Chitinispirillaceae bacterium]
MIRPVSRLSIKIFLIFTFIFGTGEIFSLLADGLPAEYLITQRWNYMFSSRSPLTNPALINEENYFSGKYAFASTLRAFRLHELGFVLPIGLYQSVGITALMQQSGEVNMTDDKYNPLGTLDFNNTMFYLTYANNLLSGLTVGANINGAIVGFSDDPTKIGFGVDAGLTYRLLNNPVIGNHLLGLAVQNIFTFFIQPFEQYSRSLRANLISHYWEKRIESAIDFTLKDIGVASSLFDTSKVEMEWDLNVRLGFWVIRMFNLYGLFGFSDDGLGFWGFAGGINMPSVNNGRDLSFIYQYITMPQDETFTHTLYLRGDFGKHREEIYARKMAKMANLAPNDLYIKALEQYNAGNYWDAFFLFSQLFGEYPDFFKNDWVSYFIGSCQEQMDMRTTAEEAYQKTRQEYARSAAVPFSDLGLMRIYYRNGDFPAVENQFNELNKLGVPDSIKFHGYYLMGQTEILKGNPSKAKQLFDLIPETHPDYVFAQHSAAISEAAADNIESAISYLENCIQAQTTTKAQQEIVNRSYVFLGYIFYEELTKQEGPLAKAVTALRSVPKTSFYYMDALLGLAWTGLKARQWNDCLAAGSELATIGSSPVLKAEGALLQAYAHMMQKNYANAASLLEGASQALESFQPPSEAELSQKAQEHDQVRQLYTELARVAYDLGSSRQSDKIIKQVDSLETHQKNYKSKIDEFIKYSDQFARASFFARNLEAVKEDVDYALAVAQNKAGMLKQTKETDEFRKKDADLEKELEDLKKKLEEEGSMEE